MAVVSIETRLERVTVYASGARVRRVTELAEVPPRVRISGLPIAVMDDTVRVEIEGPAIAATVRAGVDAPEEAAAAAAEEAPALRAARRRLQLAEAEVERLRAALEQLARTPIAAADPSDEPPPPWGDVVAARRAVIALRAERDLALREQLAAARAEVEAAQRVAEAAADRDRRAGTARAAKLHELRKHVEIELQRSGDGPIVLTLEYLVGAARWAPSYVARLGAGGDAGGAAAVEIRAVVAQDTGEDWSGVPLLLSTAEPARFAVLPELAAQRIGRRQQEPARAGFRAPPVGAESLFADFDRDRRRLAPGLKAKPFTARSQFEDGTYMGRPPAREAPNASPAYEGGLAEEVWDEDSSRAKEAYDAPSLGGAAFGGAPYPANRPAPGAPPPPQPARPKADAPREQAELRRRAEPDGAGGPPRTRSATMRTPVVPAPSAPSAAMPMPFQAQAAVPMAKGRGGGDSKKLYEPEPPSESLALLEPPPPTARLDYGNLRMAQPSAPARGRLVPAPPAGPSSVIDHEVAAMQRRVATLELPAGCAAAWLHTYDYAFATDGAVDVRSDGAWHSIAVTARPAPAKVRHVAVPREQADVFRVAAVENPFPGPLLPGPIDVYDRGRFLVTSAVDYTPPGGSVEIGLGVDPAVKIARNSEFREEVGGMLRGALKLIHGVTVEVENLSARAVELEVRERLPVAREGDDDVEITPGRVEPAWERWTPEPEGPGRERLRGGYRWRLSLAPAQKRTLRAGYEVKISGKHELVGGNRREP